MDLKLVDCKKMKSLDDYAMALLAGMISIKTLESFHVKAVSLGILKEDLECRANTIVWDLKRMLKLYQDQCESILDLLPTETFEKAMKSLKEDIKTQKKSITKTKT